MYTGPVRLAAEFRTPRAQTGARARGQALVEFGLILPVLLVIFLGVIDFGRAFYAGVAAQQAARDAARLGAGMSLDDGISTTRIQNQLLSGLGWPNADCNGCQNQLGLNTAPTVRIGGYQSDGTKFGWADGAGSASQALCQTSCGGGQVQVEVTFDVPLYTSFLTRVVGLEALPIRGWAAMTMW